MNKKSNLKEWLVIVNPNAGKSKGRKDWGKISGILKREGIQFDVNFTERKGHAITLTLNGITAGFRKIITVGGDGTLNEVANGVFLNKECPTTDISLALIPVGTGNDWGKMFGIPRDYEKAIRIIRNNKIMLHDIGLISFFEGTEKKKRFFINTAGLGFESVVIKRTNTHKGHGRSGKAIYLHSLLVSFLSYKNTMAEIIIDGDKINADIFSINIGNGRYCGGGMSQTPNALPDDGAFDVTIIKGIKKIELLRGLKMLYDGSLLNHPKIDGYRCKSIKIDSDTPIYTEADGESLGHTPVEFSIIPSSVNIVYGTRVIQ